MAQRDRSGKLLAGLSPRRVLLVAAVFIIGYFAVSIAGNAVTQYQLTRDQDQLRRQIATLEAQQRDLDALRAYMQTDEFVEHAAHEQGLVRPGETSAVILAPTPAATPRPPADGMWWMRYFGSRSP
jgi:cell division protein FtsL